MDKIEIKWVMTHGGIHEKAIKSNFCVFLSAKNIVSHLSAKEEFLDILPIQLGIGHTLEVLEPSSII